jgi:hypothetical protein
VTSTVKNDCWGPPKDIVEARERSREIVKASPRSTREINGQMFTVVHIPEATVRDLRDPKALGEGYLLARKKGGSIEMAATMNAPDYKDGGHISSNPEEHHSKTPQNLGDLDDGGAS